MNNAARKMIAQTHFAYEVIAPGACLLGEGPLWDAANKTTWWVDIMHCRIHAYHTIQQQHETFTMDSMVGAVALCEHDALLVAMQSGIALFDKKNGNTTLIAHPESHLPNNRYNDGKCDPAGRFWIGTMSLDEEPNAGNLYVLDHDGTVEHRVDNVTISNGLAWSADAKTMYYIDTTTHNVFAFDFDVQTSSISNRRVVISIEESEGFPDGMTIDAEDMLWIAHWSGWRITRWNPQTGEKLLDIPLPAANITSCTFGGEHLQDLYISSARKDLSPEQLATQPLAGSLFVIKHIGVTGLPATKYRYKGGLL